ncbi:MAG: hypothetical protein AB1444_08335 [Spirochaetota bacterium]
MEVFSHFAIKQDLENLRVEFLIKLEKLDKKFNINFAVLLFTIIFLHQNALEFIATVVELIR